MRRDEEGGRGLYTISKDIWLNSLTVIKRYSVVLRAIHRKVFLKRTNRKTEDRCEGEEERKRE